MASLALYQSCVSAISRNFEILRKNGSDQDPPLTFDMWFDICRHLSDSNNVNALFEELTNVDILYQFLKLGHKRKALHLIYEKVNKVHANLNSVVVKSFAVKAGQDKCWALSAGQHLASFLIDAGWFLEAAEVLEIVLSGIDSAPCSTMRWNVMAKLLQARSEFRQFDKADDILKSLGLDLDTNFNQLSKDVSYLYCEVANYYFWRSMYNDSYLWSLKSVKSVCATTPKRVVIDILRQAGKSCVVTRRYPLAQLLLREALLKAHEIYGQHHLKYADCLQDYAFYLLNVDKVGLSVQAYEQALNVRFSNFLKF